MATESDRKRVAELRQAVSTLKSCGIEDSLGDVEYEIRKLNRPHIGETLHYGDREVVVVSVDNHHVIMVPAGTDILSTHQGNLFDKDGNNIYHVGAEG